MGTDSYLTDKPTQERLASCKLFEEKFVELDGKSGERFLEIINAIQVHGTFNSETRLVAGTTNLVTPNADGSIWVTDLLISGERQPNSTVAVVFTDDVESEVLFLASQVDAPPSVSVAFAGRIQGWKDARIDMITTGAADATVTLGYIKIPNGLPFAEWDANR